MCYIADFFAVFCTFIYFSLLWYKFWLLFCLSLSLVVNNFAPLDSFPCSYSLSKWEREQHWRETHGKQTNLKFSVRLAQFMVRLLHGFSLNSAHWWMHLFKVKISWWVLHTIYGISLNLPERRKDNKTNEISSIFQRHATINEKPYN